MLRRKQTYALSRYRGEANIGVFEVDLDDITITYYISPMGTTIIITCNGTATVFSRDFESNRVWTID